MGSGISTHSVQIEVDAVVCVSGGQSTVTVLEDLVRWDRPYGIGVGGSEVEIIVLIICSTRGSLGNPFLAKFILGTVIRVSKYPKFGEILRSRREAVESQQD